MANREYNFLAAFLGWVVPGLGHVAISQKRRGILIMLGAFFLIFSGVLIGGLDAIDHKQDSLWFLCQVFAGPVIIVVDALNQFFIASLPTAEKATFVGLNHANEMGTLFVAMAGLMNFVIILDALKPASKTDLESNHNRRLQD